MEEPSYETLCYSATIRLEHYYCHCFIYYNDTRSLNSYKKQTNRRKKEEENKSLDQERKKKTLNRNNRGPSTNNEPTLRKKTKKPNQNKGSDDPPNQLKENFLSNLGMTPPQQRVSCYAAVFSVAIETQRL